MRKSPTFPDRECTLCGKIYTPHNSRQKYCSECKVVASKETKRRFYIKKNPNAYAPKEPKKHCIVCGEPMSSYFEGKPYCNKHWLRMYNNGTINPKPYKTKNTYQISGNFAIGTTSRGDTYKIDLDDLERCKQHSWIKDPRGYFVSRIGKKNITLHRFILGITESKLVTDHINGDKSDNRKLNLRICSQNKNGKNMRTKKNNSSGITGVRKVKSGSWIAVITVNGKAIHLGTFNSKLNAIDARRSAEIKYYGEFSPFICRQK